jgi:hypothetical protein
VPVGAQALEATVQQLLIEIRAKGNGYLPMPPAWASGCSTRWPATWAARRPIR